MQTFSKAIFIFGWKWVFFVAVMFFNDKKLNLLLQNKCCMDTDYWKQVDQKQQGINKQYTG